MSETYVTYRVWGGCKAPLNLEYDGRLIGEITRELIVDRDALLALADEIHGLVENQEIRFFHVVQVHESTLSTIERRIREACREVEG